MRILATAVIAAAMAASPAMAKTELVVHYPMPQVFGSIHETLAKDFMAENPDITISFRAPSANYEEAAQLLLRQSMSDQLPDVSFQGLNRVRILADRELAVKLDPFIKDEAAFAKQGFTKSVRSLGQVKGGQYALAFSASTPIIYFNADLVKQAGGDPAAFPADWDGVIALGKKINDLGNDTDGLYYHFWGSDWMWQAALGSFGGQSMNDAETDVTFDDEKGVKAATLLGRFTPEAGMRGYNRDAAQQSFQAGKLGIMVDSSGFLARLEKGVGDRFPLRTAPFPIADKANASLPTGGAAVVMLTKDAKKQEAAWKYMTFVTGPKGAATVVRMSGYAPTNEAVAEHLGDFYAQNPNHRAAQQQVKYLGPWFAYPTAEGVKVTDVIMRRLRDVMDKGADPKQTVSEIADEVRKTIAR
ncbi:ABC transporter substrate-binding protein [Oceanibaculum nanhaiense]|uniref:ABC transporter substrate-binding protein n=1 Tax=Oceanibaculum nanhaiense TaxID=1909734 RepID=UPI00396E6A05